MDDDIQLPPLPLFLGAPGMDKWIDDARIAAVRYDRERRARVTQKPAIHEAHIRWTAGGEYVWIESERNRELARSLRRMYHDNAILAAADALDGGERFKRAADSEPILGGAA